MQSDQFLVLEQIAVDNEIAHFCERVFEGVDVNPEKVLTEDILNLARSSELYFSGLLDRHTIAQWVKLGKPGLYSNARKRVEEILAEPTQDPLPDNVTGILNEILVNADRQLS